MSLEPAEYRRRVASTGVFYGEHTLKLTEEGAKLDAAMRAALRLARSDSSDPRVIGPLAAAIFADIRAHQ